MPSPAVRVANLATNSSSSTAMSWCEKRSQNTTIASTVAIESLSENTPSPPVPLAKLQSSPSNSELKDKLESSGDVALLRILEQVKDCRSRERTDVYTKRADWSHAPLPLSSEENRDTPRELMRFPLPIRAPREMSSPASAEVSDLSLSLESTSFLALPNSV